MSAVRRVAPAVTIQPEDIAEFERSGAIVLRGLFDARWIDELRTVIERALAGLRTGRTGVEFDTTVDVAWHHPAALEFVMQSPAAAIARTLLRSRTVRFYGDQLFVKEPGVEAPTPWHNDQPYWPISGTQICSIWLALDPVTQESSGLEYVRGSHRWGKFFRPTGFTERRKEMFAGAEGEEIPDISGRRTEFEFLAWDMEPGDCLVHHALTVHGAGGNTTRDRRRRAYSTRWAGDDARYLAPRPGMANNLVDAALLDGGPLDSPKFPLVIGS